MVPIVIGLVEMLDFKEYFGVEFLKIGSLIINAGVMVPIVIGMVDMLDFKEYFGVEFLKIGSLIINAGVMELVDMLDLGSSASRRKSSSLFARTKASN